MHKTVQVSECDFCHVKKESAVFISQEEVRTPEGWVSINMGNVTGQDYWFCSGEHALAWLDMKVRPAMPVGAGNIHTFLTAEETKGKYVRTKKGGRRG